MTGVSGSSTTTAVSAIRHIEQVRLVLKADGVGTLEALQMLVNDMKTRAEGEVNVEVVYAGVGDVGMGDLQRVALNTAAPSKSKGGSDVDNLQSTHAMVLGFNVGMADNETKIYAKQNDIAVTRASIVYRLEEQLCALINQVMPKREVLKTVGTARVLKLFPLRDKKGSLVAGLQVDKGVISIKDGHIFRVTRGERVVVERAPSNTASLRSYKEVVKEVSGGGECGLVLARVADFLAGDLVECLKISRESKTIELKQLHR